MTASARGFLHPFGASHPTGATSPDRYVGMVLDSRYFVTGMLGRGGMGHVLRARCVETGGPCAIKVIAPEALGAHTLARFRNECVAASAVRHRNVVEVLGTGSLDDGSPYLAMELLTGETLRARIQQTGPLPVSDAVAIGLQLLDALGSVHAHGYVHRDVNPGNVFLTSARKQPPKVKLIDFGVAKTTSDPALALPRVDDAEITHVTRTGMVAGTPNYIPPEEYVASRGVVDARLDLWAAGLTLYEALTGTAAFGGSPATGLRNRILFDEPPSPSDLRPDVPRPLSDVIMRALAKDPQWRLPSAAELRRALVRAWSEHRWSAANARRRFGE